MSHNTRKGVWLIVVNGSNYLLGRVNQPVEGSGAQVLEDDLRAQLRDNGALLAMLFPVYQLDCSFFPVQQGQRRGCLPLQTMMRIERRIGILDDMPPLAVQGCIVWFLSDCGDAIRDHFGALVENADNELRMIRAGMSPT